MDQPIYWQWTCISYHLWVLIKIELPGAEKNTSPNFRGDLTGPGAHDFTKTGVDDGRWIVTVDGLNNHRINQPTQVIQLAHTWEKSDLTDLTLKSVVARCMRHLHHRGTRPRPMGSKDNAVTIRPQSQKKQLMKLQWLYLMGILEVTTKINPVSV